jgi:hypothetical protein
LRYFPKDKHYPAFLRFINVAKARGSGSRRDRSINSLGPTRLADGLTMYPRSEACNGDLTGSKYDRVIFEIACARLRRPQGQVLQTNDRAYRRYSRARLTHSRVRESMKECIVRRR